MTDENEAATTKLQYVASHTKRAVRRILLTVFALPVIIVGVFLALPYLLDDPELRPDEGALPRMLMILVASLVAICVVHFSTKSWSHVLALPRGPEEEENNG